MSHQAPLSIRPVEPLKDRKSQQQMWRGAIVLTITAIIVGPILVDSMKDSSSSSPAPSGVSADCAAAFEEMRVEYNLLYAQADTTDAEFNAIEVPTLNACATGSEWLAAARANPAAVGFTHSDAVDGTSLEIRCRNSPSTAACTNP